MGRAVKEEILKVKIEDVVLKIFYDTSAPCSHCIFLDNHLECQFPQGEKKECKERSGIRKGWITDEYILKGDIK